MLECFHTGASQFTYLFPQLRTILGLANMYQHIAKQCHMAVDLHNELQEECKANVLDERESLIYARYRVKENERVQRACT